jgi:hypothetical protein
MSQVNPGKLVTITAKYETGYRPNYSENVFQVDQSPITVNKDETVDIMIDCLKGFSVFIPIFGFFEGNVFDSSDSHSWLPDQSTAEEKWWGLRLTRTMLDNPNKSDKELPYCIYSKDLNNFAVGNSPPKMKLEP